MYVTKVDVKMTEISIQWSFDSKGRQKKAIEGDEYFVGVRIKYKKESDKEYLTFPEDGSRILVEQVCSL